MSKANNVIIATRKSKLALWQANHIKQQLEAIHPTTTFTLLAKKTTGDQRQDVALSDIGGKNLFAKELQKALLDHEADIAVHSIKDLSAVSCPGLTLGAICKREDPRDAFISTTAKTVMDLPQKAIVGTASPRRQMQLLAKRPDLHIKLLRGNVGTRLEKLANGEFDAIILAAAGLKRLGLTEHITDYFDEQDMIPAIGQGAIGIECREGDSAIQALIKPLQHQPTTSCVTAERALNAYLKGSCFTPMGAHATLTENILTLEAILGTLDGSKTITTTAQGDATDAANIGKTAGQQLMQKDAEHFLQN